MLLRHRKWKHSNTNTRPSLAFQLFFLTTWASIFHPQCIVCLFLPFYLSYVTSLRTAVLYVSSLDFFVWWGQCSSFRAGLEEVLGSGDRSQHLAVFRDTNYSILKSCSFQVTHFNLYNRWISYVRLAFIVTILELKTSTSLKTSLQKVLHGYVFITRKCFFLSQCDRYLP